MKKLFIAVLSLFLGVSIAMAKEPLTLRDLMKELRSSVDELNHGILHEDFSVIGNAAKKIENHKKPESQKMKMLKILGFKMFKFKSMGGDVHTVASEIEELVKKRELNQIIDKQAMIIKKCTLCHSTFRNEVSKNRS